MQQLILGSGNTSWRVTEPYRLQILKRAVPLCRMTFEENESCLVGLECHCFQSFLLRLAKWVGIGDDVRRVWPVLLLLLLLLVLLLLLLLLKLKVEVLHGDGPTSQLLVVGGDVIKFKKVKPWPTLGTKHWGATTFCATTLSITTIDIRKSAIRYSV